MNPIFLVLGPNYKISTVAFALLNFFHNTNRCLLSPPNSALSISKMKAQGLSLSVRHC